MADDIRERRIPDNMRRRLEQSGQRPAPQSTSRSQTDTDFDDAMKLDIDDSALQDLLSSNAPQVPPPQAPRQPPQPARTREVVTNNTNSGGAMAPPNITPEQIRAKLARNKDENKEKDAPSRVVSPAKPRLIVAPTTPETVDYTRIELLSGFIFYEHDELQVRKIDLVTHIKINRAQSTNDFSLLVDAIGSTLLPGGLDIRDLTVPDFYFLLYWHRLNSYSSTPFNVTWTSKYGNQNTYRITDTDISYEPPKLSKEDFLQWYEEGYDLPRVRDIEVWEREEFSPEEEFIWNKAQWFRSLPYDNPPSLQGKVDGMMRTSGASLGAIERLNEFKKAIEHSINEVLEVTDAKFDAVKYMEGRIAYLKELKSRAVEIENSNPILYASYSEEIEIIGEEIKIYEAQLNMGGKVLPDIERVSLNLKPFDFFPAV